ncbi:hypothetical protein Q765_06495 [Flavobacterium rivuli WB 3.3-2 = DSM 21788]|uniref:Uncharacterized protein n=1 Tax=Flavobacterium rivuli WB 3.3-2 = DSM 21788 TaxID=1121895 RepID=A0A0A2M6R9_9FLAO|nr:hypothetical protein [Flavobacterium rivuli]KGO87311.1 hypothetical protein Q765_06495 [Flavobacterium rivuli WB 3.3-2 = DSM 21788]
MKYFSFLFLILALYSCKKEILVTEPSAHITKTEQESFKYSVIRYVDDLAYKATEATKFDTIYNKEYTARAQKADLLHYYKDKDGTVYFAIAKIAPSLKLKKVATIGKLKYGADGKIAEYEEAIRTWKMEEPELRKKTAMLFEKYVHGDDVSPYYTANAKGEFYIEFPDANTYYDKTARSWAVKK